jgi:tetratricopeptide (TPR) repeat protein
VVGTWLLLLAFAASAGGCRALRSRKPSDENIAEARQLSLQGLDAQQRGHWERAEGLFASAILKCPADERARAGYAESLWQRGDYEHAISHMEEAARLSGNDPQRLVQLGEMYRARGDFERASQQADRAIAANPLLATAWALRGHALQARGNRTEALASFHRALAYEQALPEVQLAIAELYLQEQRPQRALATLQSLAAHSAGENAPVELLVRQAAALRDLGRFQAAERLLADAAEHRPPSADLLYELARVQLLAGDATAARQSVSAALDAQPQHAGALALQQQLGTPETIVAAAQRMPRAAP